MADLQTKSFTTLVTEQATAIQGAATSLVDFTIGSVLRSIVEAYSAIALWLQALVLQVLALTRASTSSGADLDSWMADFGIARLPAAAATGEVTFSRFTPTALAVVPVGTLIQTSDGSQQYAVVLDASNPAYSASQGGFVIPAGQISVSVEVQAQTPGAAGNASLGGINVISQAIAGVDTVTNGAPFTNGSDAETDADLRTRFVNYLASLSKATKAAINYATTSVQSGITNQLVENENLDGTAHLGFFYDVVDDGSGDPPDALISTVYGSVDAVRPIGVNFAIFKPTKLTVSAVMVVKVALGNNADLVAATVQAALIAYINALPLGQGLAWSRLIQVAYDASPAVIDVTGYTLNGGTADVSASANDVIKAGAVTVAGTN